LFPKHGSFEIARRKPERETRIPGLAPRARSPEARGLPEGTRREPDTDGGADLKGLLWRRRSSAATNSCNPVCRIVRLDERWW
jgi:hypothetical protein